MKESERRRRAIQSARDKILDIPKERRSNTQTTNLRDLNQLASPKPVVMPKTIKTDPKNGMVVTEYEDV